MLLTVITVFALLCAVAAGVCGGLWSAALALIGGFFGGLLLAFLFLVAACLVVDLEKPQNSDSKFYRTLARLYIDLVITLGRVELRTEGLEKVPADGRFMLVCNHLCDIDSAIVLKCFSKSQLAFIGKKETKTMPFVGKVMHKLMCQFLNRENDREALKTILRCIQLLKEDQVSIAVFPEGYVSMDGRVRHFRSGVFKIAQRAGVPIAVCTIRNTKRALKDVLRLRKTWVQLHLVEVIDGETAKAMPTVEMAKKVYEIMISDLGEKYRSEEKAMLPALQTCIDPIE